MAVSIKIMVQALKFSWWLLHLTHCWATSCMRWLNGKRTFWEPCPLLSASSSGEWWVTRTEIVLGTLVCLLFNQLTWLVAEESFVVLRLWFAAIWCHAVVPKERGGRFPEVPACIYPCSWSRIPEDLNCERVPHLVYQMLISGCSWVSILLGLLRFFIDLIILATMWSWGWLML